MKKLLFIALSGMMLLAFTQCGGNKGSQEYQDGMKIYKQMEKAIKTAATCDELDQAVENMIEQALTLEKEYTEGDKATKEEEEELNKMGDELRNLLNEKSEKLGCNK